jgi:CRP-like cAMP-binding protein
LIVEIGMLSPNKQRSQSIKCLEDCLFLLISEEKVFQVYTQNPEFGLYLIKMAVDRLLTNVKNKTAIAME